MYKLLAFFTSYFATITKPSFMSNSRLSSGYISHYAPCSRRQPNRKTGMRLFVTGHKNLLTKIVFFSLVAK